MDYVGIDLHKTGSQICMYSTSGEVVEKRIATKRSEFEEFFQRLDRAQVLLEASTESEWVAVLLESLGHTVIVADPNFAPMYATLNKRIKTDRRDAVALADACRQGTYRAAHRKSPEQRHRSNQLVVRDKLVGMRTKCIVTIRALLRQLGLRLRSGSAEKFEERLAELPLDALTKKLTEQLLAPYRTINEQLTKADQELAAQAKGDPVVERLMTVPGVGPITATAFVWVIDNAARFANGHLVASYVGLVPGERSSGEIKQRTSITKTGSSMLRSLLVQCALTIMRTRTLHTPLRDWAQRIAARRGNKIARVALARKLAGLLFALMRDGCRYDPNLHRAKVPITTAA